MALRAHVSSQLGPGRIEKRGRQKSVAEQCADDAGAIGSDDEDGSENDIEVDGANGETDVDLSADETASGEDDIETVRVEPHVTRSGRVARSRVLIDL